MNFSSFAGLGSPALRNEQKVRYKDLFDFAAECLDLAMNVSLAIPDTIQKSDVPACLLFARALTHFQAAVSLSEGGMVIEALITCRSLVETGFVLAALAERGVSPQDLMNHDLACRQKIAKVFLRPNNYENLEQFKGGLEDLVSENANSKEISLFTFAEKGKVTGLYDGVYRHLSHFAAHPSLSATDAYLFPDEDNNSGQFLPALHYAPAALLSACMGLLVCLFGVDKIFSTTAFEDVQTGKLFDKYEALYAHYDPWDR